MGAAPAWKRRRTPNVACDYVRHILPTSFPFGCGRLQGGPANVGRLQGGPGGRMGTARVPRQRRSPSAVAGSRVVPDRGRMGTARVGWDPRGLPTSFPFGCGRLQGGPDRGRMSTARVGWDPRGLPQRRRAAQPAAGGQRVRHGDRDDLGGGAAGRQGSPDGPASCEQGQTIQGRGVGRGRGRRHLRADARLRGFSCRTCRGAADCGDAAVCRRARPHPCRTRSGARRPATRGRGSGRAHRGRARRPTRAGRGAARERGPLARAGQGGAAPGRDLRQPAASPRTAAPQAVRRRLWPWRRRASNAAGATV